MYFKTSAGLTGKSNRMDGAVQTPEDTVPGPTTSYEILRCENLRSHKQIVTCRPQLLSYLILTFYI